MKKVTTYLPGEETTPSI